MLFRSQSVLTDANETPVLVFDELDQGVGGRLGQVIGAKLAGLARSHQVLCVTHLPQVAVFADAHFVVSKSVEEGRTLTQVRRVDGPERLEELALLLSGPPVGPAALNGAEEMLSRAEAWKQKEGAATPG